MVCRPGQCGGSEGCRPDFQPWRHAQPRASPPLLQVHQPQLCCLAFPLPGLCYIVIRVQLNPVLSFRRPAPHSSCNEKVPFVARVGAATADRTLPVALSCGLIVYSSLVVMYCTNITSRTVGSSMCTINHMHDVSYIDTGKIYTVVNDTAVGCANPGSTRHLC